jgi:queuine/archaeosine tRNA-ribosyltransferase
MRAGELTGAVLATLHNLRFYLDFMGDLRQAIALGALADLAASLACGQAGPMVRAPHAGSDDRGAAASRSAPRAGSAD